MASQSLREHVCWEETGDGKQKEEKWNWRLIVSVGAGLCVRRVDSAIFSFISHQLSTYCVPEWAMAPLSGSGDYWYSPRCLGQCFSLRGSHGC